MISMTFKCLFLSDVILNAQGATEGNQKTLDYVPGSNFLGILARKYDAFSPSQAYHLFHSGQVCFGDAHPASEDERTFKVPLSWFVNKGDSLPDTRYVHHALTESHHREIIQKPRQLKQIRSGWLTETGKEIKPVTSFAVKAAYDRSERRSADAQLFSYRSLREGTEWMFSVTCPHESDAELIKNELVGEHFIGRSRSAQYGRIHTTHLSTNATAQKTTAPVSINGENCLVVYADSRLAFNNTFGQPTLQPTAEQLGFPDWTIDWELSQIRTHVFSPWNGKVNHHLPDRACFDKGSVFILTQKTGGKGQIPVTLTVGEHKSEGFGCLLVNPAFLACGSDGVSTFKVDKPFIEGTGTVGAAVRACDPSDTILDTWLVKQQDENTKEKEIYKKVRAFCENNSGVFQNITSSQWGQIRALSTQADSFASLQEVLFKKVTPNDDGKVRSHDRAAAGFLRHGKAAEKWKGIDILENELRDKGATYGTEYAVRLAAQMQKFSRGQSGGVQ